MMPLSNKQGRILVVQDRVEMGERSVQRDIEVEVPEVVLAWEAAVAEPDVFRSTRIHGKNRVARDSYRGV